MHEPQPVDEALLKKLSLATQLVGKTVMIKNMPESECQAIVTNAIIFPFSDFYRTQFLNYYKQHHQNAVKALKELLKQFAYTPDYRLDIGYMLSTSPTLGLSIIKHRNDFVVVNDLAVNRQEIYQSMPEHQQEKKEE